ncbi:MAG TPA: DUF4389 domain-containing protein [Steroidobacteraceae bacterium]|nr:DUF4389 domain-containing protein [Steroidobacteraceae bacterium]
MSSLPQPVESPPGDLGVRFLYMVLFAAVFWIVSWTLALTAIAQLLVRLSSGRVSAELARFGGALARYTKQIVEFLTFVTERVPYPVGEFPVQ